MIVYADNGRIAGKDHKWVQDVLLVTVAILHRMGLEKILEKTKAMVCTPGFILEKWGDKEFKKQSMG